MIAKVVRAWINARESITRGGRPRLDDVAAQPPDAALSRPSFASTSLSSSLTAASSFSSRKSL